MVSADDRQQNASDFAAGTPVQTTRMLCPMVHQADEDCCCGGVTLCDGSAVPRTGAPQGQLPTSASRLLGKIPNAQRERTDRDLVSGCLKIIKNKNFAYKAKT